MSKTLIIAEKPTVARDIARVLKCSGRGQGCIVGENYIISWAVGHLITLCEPEDYSENLKAWSMSTLPIIPEQIELKPIDNTRDQYEILNNLMHMDEVTNLICATDSGREGELIFRYIYEKSECKKPVKRLWISSMTDQAITEGFANLKPSIEYDNLFYSARCRSEADWLVGINATRAFTNKYHTLLSIGRVQTPTLALIVAKQEEINAFDSKDYFEVDSKYQGFSGTYIDDEGNTKIATEAEAKTIAESANAQMGKVVKIEKEDKKQPAPLLYDLTELQRECNRKFALSAKDTLAVAQTLYETKKLITYPRTDSRYLSDDMQAKVTSTMGKVARVDIYKEFAAPLLAKPLKFTKRIIDNSKVSDHHAIIPTDVNINLAGLSEIERKVYNLIVMRFMAVFYPNYCYQVTKVTINIAGYNFQSRGTIITQDGYMAIYNKLDEKAEPKKTKSKAKKDEVKEEQVLPPLEEGMEVFCQETEVLKKKTSPPKAYTEATLLSAMENAGRFVEDEDIKEKLKESGLGTPATRAAIIERLISVGYIERKGKSLIPTEKGVKLIAIVPNELKSPVTTGKWEKGLSSIARGEMNSEKFMGSIKKYVVFLVDVAKKVQTDVVFADRNTKFSAKSQSLGNCPLCGKGTIHKNSKSYFCSEWKGDCRFTIWQNALEKSGIELTDEIIRDLLTKGKSINVVARRPNSDEQVQVDIGLNLNVRGYLEFLRR